MGLLCTKKAYKIYFLLPIPFIPRANVFAYSDSSNEYVFSLKTVL